LRRYLWKLKERYLMNYKHVKLVRTYEIKLSFKKNKNDFFELDKKEILKRFENQIKLDKKYLENLFNR
jgi:hypothetical protein